MSSANETIEISKCASCHVRYLPSDGPCPKCGANQPEALSAAGIGKVLASTELVNPSEGWTSPHRLALIELADSVRVLAVVEGSLPAFGAVVSVRQQGEIYRARPEPTPTGS